MLQGHVIEVGDGCDVFGFGEF